MRGRADGLAPLALPELHGVGEAPVVVESIELLRGEVAWFVRARSADGAEGLAVAGDRVAYLGPLLEQRVAPWFVGKDIRELPALIEGVYLHASNYKLAGLPLWCCVAWCEFALLDLLGKVVGRAVGELLGGVTRREVPVYLSSLRRDTAPEQEVAWLGERLAQTGARAVKVKAGGRMSANADAAPGRTERLVALARETFGPDVAIYVDANGSYDADHAIEVGRLLADHEVAFFEEPCPWEDYAATRRVTAELELPVAGGEQDSSLWRFADLVDTRVVDIVQPDVTYAGGLLRTLAVARHAAAAGLPTTPHSPKADANEAYLLHLVSVAPLVGPHHEYAAAFRPHPGWYTPAMTVRDGALPVPDGPGLGLAIDPAVVPGG